MISSLTSTIREYQSIGSDIPSTILAVRPGRIRLRRGLEMVWKHLHALPLENVSVALEYATQICHAHGHMKEESDELPESAIQQERHLASNLRSNRSKALTY
jgi:hypothetical protein